MLAEPVVHCPYCGEQITLLVDCTAGDQSYIEDCFVCCQPIRVNVQADAGELLAIAAEREDD